MLDTPVCEFPKPISLPPRVVVVLNQMASVKVFGAATLNSGELR